MEASTGYHTTIFAKMAERVLAKLTKCVKWHEDDKSVKVGDLVLLRENGVKRRSWPLGRIEQVHPGQDGIVRVVDVRTKTLPL